ncbi:MAG TPA: alpha/beta hydrolase [Aldersonia sp.]
MAMRQADSDDGTEIFYRVTGPADARTLVLVHGWAVDHSCWGGAAADLAERYRVIAVDLRGHGYSGAPETGYDDPRAWAADLSAVLRAEDATDAVLVGWSYGGLVITDYVAVCGTANVAGLVYVGAVTSMGRDQPGGRTGAAMTASIPGVFAEDAETALAGFGEFGDALTGPGHPVEAQRILGTNLATRPRVRKAMFYRTTGNDAVLRDLDVPALLLHGTRDPISDIASAEHAATLIPDARTSYWTDAQHGLFVEDTERFVREVSEFVDSL